MAVPDLFDAHWYLRENPDVAVAVDNSLEGARAHFEMHGKAEGRAPGPLFNPTHYVFENPDVAKAMQDVGITAYDHFIQHGAAEGRSPLALFDEDFYLEQNPDVAVAVDAGHMTAVEHFLNHGQYEPRPVSVAVDLGAYVEANPDLEDAVNAGVSPFAHLVTHGVLEGRPLGNGVSLADFQGDAAFQEALTAGNPDAVLARVEAVAPFLPSFEPPANWEPAPDTPIPTDFTPPEGVKLVIPEGVEVPPGTDLDNFEPQFSHVEAELADLTGVATTGDDLLWVGNNNPANDFLLATNDEVGIQVGLDVRYRSDPNEVEPVIGNHFVIDPANIETARFAYTVAAFEPGTETPVALDLENFGFRLKIDTDPSEDTEFLTFTLVRQDTEESNDPGNPSPYEWVLEDGGTTHLIQDDGGDEHVTQNIQALQWYQEGGALPEEGDVYTVGLEAYGKHSGDLAASSEIIIEIGTTLPLPPLDPLTI